MDNTIIETMNNWSFINELFGNKKPVKRKTEVEWKWPVGRASIDDVKYIENTIGLKLPIDYLKIAMKYNYARPMPNTIMPGKEVFNNLITLSRKDENSMVEIYKFVSESASNLIVPFATDPAGNYFCFKYKDSRDRNPVVVFWDHENWNAPVNSLKVLAKSFTDLVSKLYEP